VKVSQCSVTQSMSATNQRSPTEPTVKLVSLSRAQTPVAEPPAVAPRSGCEPIVDASWHLPLPHNPDAVFAPVQPSPLPALSNPVAARTDKGSDDEVEESGTPDEDIRDPFSDKYSASDF
jgi:hypothetical protein